MIAFFTLFRSIPLLQQFEVGSLNPYHKLSFYPQLIDVTHQVSSSRQPAARPDSVIALVCHGHKSLMSYLPLE